MIVTRFAPSPTGTLHLGHAFSAVLGTARARETGGNFLLRIEDLDQTRSRPEFVDGIFEDLSWLGLEWDEPVLVQSERTKAYAAALDGLRSAGLVYACFCTRADIAQSLTAPHGDAAAFHAATRADDLMFEGDHAGAATWRRILQRINDLEDWPPGEAH